MRGCPLVDKDRDLLMNRACLLVGAWFLVLAGWIVAEANQWARATWLPVVEGDPTHVATQQHGLTIAGLLLLTAILHLRGTVARDFRPRGLPILALLVVGTLLLFVGTTALGLALLLPGVGLVAIGGLLDFVRHRDRIQRRKGYADLGWSAMNWWVLAGADARQSRCRMIVEPRDADDERAGVTWRWYSIDSAGRRDNGFSTVRDHVADHALALLRLSGRREDLGDATKPIEGSVEIDLADAYIALRDPTNLQPAVTIENERKRRQAHHLPLRVRLHIKLEPTLFGANVDVRYTYPNDDAAVSPTYTPER